MGVSLQDLSAERALLGGIIEDNGLVTGVLSQLNNDDFTIAANQIIFRLCREFVDNGDAIDLPRLRDVLEERNLLEKVGGAGYLADISDGIVSVPSHQQHLMAKLKACTLRRTLRKLGTDLAKAAAEYQSDPQWLLEVLTAEVSSLRDGNLYVEAGDRRWGDPQPLDGQLPLVLPCDVEMLPEVLRELVKDVSYRLQAPPDFAAAAVVVTLAGAVNRRAIMQPKQHDKSFLVTANLWGAIVGPPGRKKSPIIDMMMKPLQTIEEDWREEHIERMKQYQRALERHELNVAVWKDEYKKAKKSEKGDNPLPLPDRPEDEPVPPIMKRLMTHDATGEALHKLLAENPAGVFIVRDELSGLLAELDKETRKGDRQFLLTCWNGSGTHESDRIGRGNTYAKHLCASMFGSLQPARLRSYLNDVMQDRPGNDGLLQRFQVTVYPDFSSGYESIDCEANVEAFKRLQVLYSDLTALDGESPLRFCFAPDAQRLFTVFDLEIQRKVRDRNTHPAMQAHLSKYDSLMPKLAMLFTLADGIRDGVIDVKHTQEAINFVSYLESHAHRAYSLIISPERAAASELGYHLLNEGWKRQEGCFSLRDVYRHHWSGLDTSEKVRAAIDVLIDANWLRRIESDTTTGRPSEMFTINPKLTRLKG